MQPRPTSRNCFMTHRRRRSHSGESPALAAIACGRNPRVVPGRLTVTAILVAAAVALGGAARRPLPTAEHVDLARYAGTWHEVARLPNPFQRTCVGATARYTLLADGGVAVVNTCRTSRGRCRSIEGRAEAVPCSGNARLRVRFAGLAGLMPVSREGNYWIIAVDDDYTWALVGTPDRRFLWILSREPALPPEIFGMLVDRARGLGFDVDRLVR